MRANITKTFYGRGNDNQVSSVSKRSVYTMNYWFKVQ